MDSDQEDDMRSKKDAIERRIREAEAALNVVKAELAALQHVCDHPRAKEWTSRDYGGGTDRHFKCPDCGFYQVR